MKYLIMTLIVFMLVDCKKEINNSASNYNCESLQQGLMNNDAALVDSSLGDLLDMDYSEINLNRVADTISKNCGIKAVLACFDCIQTLPAQSPMILTFLSGGDSTSKELDFTTGENNRIKLLNVQ